MINYMNIKMNLVLLAPKQMGPLCRNVKLQLLSVEEISLIAKQVYPDIRHSTNFYSYENYLVKNTY